MADIKSNYIDGNTPLDTVPALWLNTAALKINQLPTSGIATGITLAYSAMQAADLATAQLEGPINTQSANYTLVVADADGPVHFTKGTAGTVTIPSGVFSVGQGNRIVQAGAGQLTIVQGAGTTLNTADTLLTRKQWSSVYWHCYAANTFLLIGDMQ